MAEYIRFATPISTRDIAELVSALLPQSYPPLNHGVIRQDTIVGVSDGRSPADATLCFVDRSLGSGAADRLKNALIIASPAIAMELQGCSLFLVPDPRALFIDLLGRLERSPGFSCFTTLVHAPPGIDPTATIDKTAVIESGVFIGAGACIAAGCVIKHGTSIGRDTRIRDNTVIGGHGIAVYRAEDGRVLRFPDLAGVVIGENVEVGASCSIPAGVLTATVIERDTIVGNLCNIGHGARIGANVWMSVGTLVGGHSCIGDSSTLGLGVAVRDNVRIGANCSLAMGSVVMRDLPDDTAVMGNPARPLPQVTAGPTR